MKYPGLQRAAEINAHAAVLTARIIAQHGRPAALSGFHVDTQRAIRND